MEDSFIIFENTMYKKILEPKVRYKTVKVTAHEYGKYTRELYLPERTYNTPIETSKYWSERCFLYRMFVEEVLFFFVVYFSKRAKRLKRKYNYFFNDCT